MFGKKKTGLAKLHYMPNGIQALSSGDHVACAVTGAAIPLDELAYWSVERQEAYAGPAEAAKVLAGVDATRLNSGDCA